MPRWSARGSTGSSARSARCWRTAPMTVCRSTAPSPPTPPDAEVIIPPRSTAVPGATAASAPTQRDQHIQMIAERGRLGWQRAVGYGRRSSGEVAMLRYKTLIGRSLRARTLPAQKVEAAVGCKVMNMMTSLGMLASRKVA